MVSKKDDDYTFPVLGDVVCLEPQSHRLDTWPTQVDCSLCCRHASVYAEVAKVMYYECSSCDFIFAYPGMLEQIDRGEFAREYDDDYWRSEFEAARQRSYGSSLARLAEAVLYCTIPIERFIDIGTGPGYLLDAVEKYLPTNAHRFYGVEKFPPLPEFRSSSENYVSADLADMGMFFECGVCVEVLEHLTPLMARNLAAAMARVSVPGSLYLFNTGLTEYVRHEDPNYLDPYKRGHITCWSVTAARHIFEPYGFVIHALRGKTWAFVVEMPSSSPKIQVPLADRIWHADPQNIALLADAQLGELLYILGRESARAYS